MHEIDSIIQEINRKYKIKDCYLCFDNDNAGENLRNSFCELGFRLNIRLKAAYPLTKDFNDDLKLLKILKLNDNKEIISKSFDNEILFGYYDNIHSKALLKEKINKNIIELINDL